MSVTDLEPYSKTSAISEAAARAIDGLFQRFGMSGGFWGTNGRPAKTFLFSLGIAAAVVGVVNTENVLSILGMHHSGALLWALIDEGSSWLTFVGFFWIIWLGWRLAPPQIRPRWKLAFHIPVMFAFCAAHVGGFLLLRTWAYRLAGTHYDYGPLDLRLLYEFRKDAFGYALFFAGIVLIDHLLRQQIVPAKQSPTFDIRDGAKLNRVMLDDILAVTSAGNYVEFVLRDGRRLMMRSPLSAIEHELAPRGFLRTHRSWLINAANVSALMPEGSGDYSVELQNITVPLSRRFPEALAKVRGK